MIILVLAVCLLVAFAGSLVVRFLPISEKTLTAWDGFGPSELGLHEFDGGAKLVVDGGAAPEQTLADFAKIIAATARTTPAETALKDTRVFVTRSKWVGFPDVVTLWVAEGRVHVMSHLVYGLYDLGVNKARLTQWAARAQLQVNPD
ncbi:MAG: DUF1499 domain-containing protein [Pseudomonadota bacterium]